MEWVEEHPDTAGLPDQHRTRASPRRSHTKSRLGCQQCKVRRIKCDELKPTCSQCSTRNSECAYPPGLEQRTSKTRPSKAAPLSKELTEDDDELDDDDYRARILQYMINVNVPRKEYISPVYGQADNAEILDHFLLDSHPWIGPPEVQTTMQKYGAQLAITAPHLLHGIMAFSASHLHHCNPNVKRYEIAQTVNFALSLNHFTSRLSKPILDVKSADPLFACAFIHSMLAFWQQAREDSDDEPFRWLRTCRGVPTLQSMKVIHQHLEESIWNDAFALANKPPQAQDMTKARPEVNAWVSSIMIKFGKLCQVNLDDEPGEEGQSIYLAPLQHLNMLIRMNIDFRKIGAMMMFNGKLSGAFVDLLESGDIRASLIFSYWHALMCNIRQWWSETQAMKECQRICQVLLKVEDDLVRDLLEWPMMQCGMILSPTPSLPRTNTEEDMNAGDNLRQS